MRRLGTWTVRPTTKEGPAPNRSYATIPHHGCGLYCTPIPLRDL